MPVNKLYIWGGAGVAALAGFYFLAKRGQAPADQGAQFYPPMVIGSGGGSAATAPAPTSTDGSIGQVLSQQLALAGIQQQTTMSQLQAQKEMALAGYQSQLDLANIDLTQTRVTALGDIWSSLFGASGAGSLNVEAPSGSAVSTSSWDRRTSQSGGGGAFFGGGFGGALPSTSQSTQDIGTTYNAGQWAGAGYTQGSIYGTVGFDQQGNLNVNVNRQTASSLTPLPAQQQQAALAAPAQ